MTGRKGREGKKLAREILEYLGVSLLLSAFIFCFLFFTSDSVAEIYLMNRGMVLTQVQAAVLTAWLRSICLAKRENFLFDSDHGSGAGAGCETNGGCGPD